MIRFFHKFLPIIAFCFLFPVMATADESALKPEEEEQQDELVISADRMELQLDGKTVELTGNVRVEDSNMSLTALKMMVYLTEAEKKEEKEDGKKEDDENKDDSEYSNMKLQRIIAEGEVKLRKLDGTESAMGERAVYDAKDDTIIMTGNCSIIQGKNTMNGDKVIYNRQKGHIDIQKPRLTIQIDKKGNKNSGALGNLFSPKDEQDKKDEKKDVKTKDDKKADGKTKDDTKANKDEKTTDEK
ncbi:MAG: hypothetical protein IKP58_03790 [Victivallales bacterium]|nr:hypothetical protein [Victivallales bacterium]